MVGESRKADNGPPYPTAILEPVLIILLAVIVLFIVLATVLPILEAGNAIG